MHPKDHTGLIGEQQAAEYLQARGHEVLERRWRSRHGELDLITRDQRQLVAVEVKTRRGIGYGHPFEAVTDAKLRRLYLLLREYAAEHGLLRVPRRVDVVSVLLDRRDTALPEPAPRIEHLKAVTL